jgi:hypothetical protein
MGQQSIAGVMPRCVQDVAENANDNTKRPASVRCREIREADRGTIAELLHTGFPAKPWRWFDRALRNLGVHKPPAGFPQFGYMLETEGKAVGALLTIATSIREGGGLFNRCNVSCWHVVPQFGIYAPLLLSRAARYGDAIYINISPAPLTWHTIEAQGFQRFCPGTFAGMPMITNPFSRMWIQRVSSSSPRPAALSDSEWDVLRDHAAYGCVSLVCRSAGETFPFVFRSRWFRRCPFPAGQLIYCRKIESLRECGGPVGRFLALRGMPWIVAGTEGTIRAVPGRYFEGKLPMYFKGAHRPRVGDLAYTEAALFGF